MVPPSSFPRVLRCLWSWHTALAHCQTDHLCLCPTCKVNGWKLGPFFHSHIFKIKKTTSSAPRKPRGWQVVWLSLYIDYFPKSFFSRATEVLKYIRCRQKSLLLKIKACPWHSIPHRYKKTIIPTRKFNLYSVAPIYFCPQSSGIMLRLSKILWRHNKYATVTLQYNHVEKLALR